MSRVVTIPDHALLSLACKSEELTMYHVDQPVVDELAYLMETPKDERPGIFCLGREWIIEARDGEPLLRQTQSGVLLVRCLVRYIGERRGHHEFDRPSGTLLNTHQKRNF